MVRSSSLSAENRPSTSDVEQLYIDMRGELHRAARHVNDGEADDMVQEAFLRVVEVTQKQTVIAPLGLLRTIMRNLFVDGIRNQKRRAGLFVGAEMQDIASDDADPERRALASQRLDAALLIIADLPPRCRTAFELHRFEHLTYREVAMRMNISVSAVEKHIAYAATRLSHRLYMMENDD